MPTYFFLLQWKPLNLLGPLQLIGGVMKVRHVDWEAFQGAVNNTSETRTFILVIGEAQFNPQ
jgi:hypothetical protein